MKITADQLRQANEDIVEKDKELKITADQLRQANEDIVEKDRQLKITADQLRQANVDIEGKDNELDEMKYYMSGLRDKMQEKDRDLKSIIDELNKKDSELESVKETLDKKDSELERMTDAFKQLKLTNKSMRCTVAQMNKSGTKEELVDPNSQTPYVSATEKSKATNVSYGPNTDKRDDTLPTTCQDIRDSSLGCSSSIRKGPDPGPVTVNYVCDALDDLSSMLKRSGKYYILEDDYNISVVEGIVKKLNDMKNVIEYKRSMEMPKDERDYTLPTTSCQDIPDSSLSFSSSIRKGPDPGPVTVNYVCDALDDLSSMLKRSDKYYILEDDYNISEVEDIVMKLNDMKRSLEMPR